MNEYQEVFRLKNLTERIPLDLSRFVEDQQRRIFFASLTLDNKPGTLALVLALLLRYNINILGILSEAISKKDELEVSMFLEVPEKEVDVIDLERKLRDGINKEKMDFVKKIKVYDHLNNFDADVVHFPLFVGSLRVITFPTSILGETIKSLMKVFNPSVVRTMFWYQGKEFGRLVEEFYEKEFSIINVNEAVNFLAIRTALHGWAISEIVELDDERRNVTLRLFDNWECSMFKGSSEPQSHYIRGVLDGFFSSLFKVEMEAKETKCIAKGDPYCEFEIKEK
jgi:predicted hydrocarbon binding protein/predicted amino acid-binding ACT domain protein